MAPVAALRPADPRAAREEAELARALVAGALDAPGRAWDRFAPMVHGVLARALGPEDDVHDLTQEVFLRLFRRVATLQDPAALRSFVYSIATRVLRAELRRRWVRRIMRLSDTGALPERAADGGADADAREAVARLYRLLERLRPRDRAAYVLRHLQGLEVDEVAAALGVSRATAKRSLAHAGARMSAWIERDPLLRTYQAVVGEDGDGR